MGKNQAKISPDPLFFSQPLEVIVFDCDGVLFDSKEANARYYSQILTHIAHPPVRPDQQEFIHMHPVLESLHYLLPDEEQFEKAWAYAMSLDFRAFNAYLRCEPGLVEMLEFVKSTYHVAMATNRTVSTHEVLTHFDLEKFFDLVVSAKDVRFPKPHPESMERIMETFAVLPEQVLYVGDSAVDEALAINTGVYFAAYKNPNLKAHLHLTHFNELHSLLASESCNHKADPDPA